MMAGPSQGGSRDRVLARAFRYHFLSCRDRLVVESELEKDPSRSILSCVPLGSSMLSALRPREAPSALVAFLSSLLGESPLSLSSFSLPGGLPLSPSTNLSRMAGCFTFRSPPHSHVGTDRGTFTSLWNDSMNSISEDVITPFFGLTNLQFELRGKTTAISMPILN